MHEKSDANIVEVVKLGDRQALMEMLKAGVDVNQRDGQGSSSI